MKKVSAILKGGLGNYMFQVAAAHAYGMKHERECEFNCQEASGPHKNIVYYDDNIFKKVSLYNVRKGEQIQHVEDGFHFQEIPNTASQNMVLTGYYQSEKYFKNYENEIKNLFTSYEVELSDTVSEILKKENTCSIHVRRGDFLKHPDHHPAQNLNYFMKATKEMPRDSVFLIFSDDIEWCKNNFPKIPNKFYFIEGNRDYEDLYIMSRCKNNIICNSTFSWWGAWLNKNDNKIVVAPSNWFGPAYANHNTNDLYCDNWIKI